MQFQVYWSAEMRLIPRESLSEPPLELRIAGFPQLIADLDVSEIDCVMAEAEDRLVATPLQLIDSPPSSS